MPKSPVAPIARGRSHRKLFSLLLQNRFHPPRQKLFPTMAPKISPATAPKPPDANGGAKTCCRAASTNSSSADNESSRNAADQTADCATRLSLAETAPCTAATPPANRVADFDMDFLAEPAGVPDCGAAEFGSPRLCREPVRCQQSTIRSGARRSRSSLQRSRCRSPIRKSCSRLLRQVAAIVGNAGRAGAVLQTGCCCRTAVAAGCHRIE